MMSLKQIAALSLLGVIVNSLTLSHPATAQSIDVRNPAPLLSGPNPGTADSFVGAQYWFFIAEPGSFSGTVTRLDSPGSAVPAHLAAGVAFSPKPLGSTITSADKGELTNFSGSVKQPTRVVIMIDPGPNGLVRAARNYEVHVSGNVSFGAQSTKAPIVGTYMSMTNGYGLTKFLEDGSVVSETGARGTWSLFDADSKTYLIHVNDDHLSVKLEPGRGLVDAANTDIVSFKLQH